MSNDNAQSQLNTYQELSDSLSLVFDGIALASKALLKNPSKEQKRKLLRRIARLEAERAEIVAKMDAIENGETDVKGPTSAQVTKVADLTGKVEELAATNFTVAGALALTSQVLTVVAKIADA